MVETVKHPTVFDSAQEHLGGVYAKALLAAAVDAGHADSVLDELDAFVAEVLDKLPHLEAILSAPRVPYEAKVAMLDRALRGKVSATLLNFLKVVARHRRFDCMRAIHRAAHELYNEMTGRVEVVIRTATELAPELRTQITERLEALLGQRVLLVAEVDPEVIGGMVVRVGDTVYDGSVAGGLDRLREEAIEHTMRAVQQSLDRFEVPESS